MNNKLHPDEFHARKEKYKAKMLKSGSSVVMAERVANKVLSDNYVVDENGYIRQALKIINDVRNNKQRQLKEWC